MCRLTYMPVTIVGVLHVCGQDAYELLVYVY